MRLFFAALAASAASALLFAGCFQNSSPQTSSFLPLTFPTNFESVRLPPQRGTQRQLHGCLGHPGRRPSLSGRHLSPSRGQRGDSRPVWQRRDLRRQQRHRCQQPPRHGQPSGYAPAANDWRGIVWTPSTTSCRTASCKPASRVTPIAPAAPIPPPPPPTICARGHSRPHSRAVGRWPPCVQRPPNGRPVSAQWLLNGCSMSAQCVLPSYTSPLATCATCKRLRHNCNHIDIKPMFLPNRGDSRLSAAPARPR